MLISAVKTGELCGCRDKSIRYLSTVWTAVDVEATGAWHRLMKGTRESCDVMQTEKYKRTNMRV